MSRIKRLLRPEVQALNWKAALSVVGLSAACLAAYAHAQVPAEKKLFVQIVRPAVPGEKGYVNTKDASNNVVPAWIDFAAPGCKPEYPLIARREEQTGFVVLLVSTEADGTITNANIILSSKFELLDNAVRDQLLSGSCKAKPGTLNGEAVATKSHVQYIWRHY